MPRIGESSGDVIDCWFRTHFVPELVGNFRFEAQQYILMQIASMTMRSTRRMNPTTRMIIALSTGRILKSRKRINYFFTFI
jgi:hypothetical protein